MLTLKIDPLEADFIVAPLMLEQIAILEPYNEDTIPMWSSNRDVDKAAVEHLVHCMKVVHDYFSLPSATKFFNYENTSNS